MKHKKFIPAILFAAIFLNIASVSGQNPESIRKSFVTPPGDAKPRVYWLWQFNRVDKEGITRDLEEFKSKGISGVNLLCTGGYGGKAPLLGVKYLSPEWWELFRHAVKEAKRLNIEFGFNLSAGGWTMQGPWVTKDNAMKKVVSSEVKVTGPAKFSGKLSQPEAVDEYYHDIWVQAFRVQGDSKVVVPGSMMDIADRLKPDGQLDWDVPEGQWVILRNGYTLTGHFWSRWFAWPGPPQADTFEGGDGYEIDYLSTSALDNHFEHLGKPILEEVKKADGTMAYLWSDSWECGKLTWTQDFPNQFRRFRGYDIKPYLPVLAGYTIGNEDVSARFRDDFDRTIQDCIAENFYGHFMELCHKNGVKVGNEAGGPNDIPPQDVLKNLGYCDMPAGEFWTNGHRKAPNGYNSDMWQRLNLKQTATAAHIYGKREAMAEAFTMMDGDATHWALGPADLKPYANDAFCEGINRFMLHQATCQPPSDGKPGYEFCAGQHFTPNLTWWEQSQAFFTYLSRCQYMLQQGNFVADVCFYLGERAPTLAPPKYIVPSLGAGYDCDYSNADVLLNRMSVKDGRIMLPDGMSYRLLVLQNCTSPSPEICEKVGTYQRLQVPSTPSDAMSLEVIQKLKELILAGATVVGPPPANIIGLKNYPEGDKQLKEIAIEIWGDLDGKTRTERKFGKGRIIWGKTAREILLADGVTPDFTFGGQETNPGQFDYIHRRQGDMDIYFVINRSNQPVKTEFTFRIAGKQPEIWDAVTGKSNQATAYRQTSAGTALTLNMERFGSWFIVFQKPVSGDAPKSAKANFPELKELTELSGSWNVSFDPQWGGPASTTFTELISWTDRPEEGIKYYSGQATYKKTFDLVPEKNKKGRLFLDLGELKDVAEVRLNGKNLGVLWSAPWRVEITDAVKSTGNKLEVDVINLWANRVIGDLNQPVEKRFTKTHDGFRFDFLAPKTQLLRSGLMGPVKLYLADD
ncbi:MAG: glycosyl hydrolase [Bacteroidota bacterium]